MRQTTPAPLGILLMLAGALLLSACASGPVRRVSEPAAGIQQLTVHANGSWTVLLRLDNFSSIPMAFGRIDMAMTLDGEPAGALQGDAAITVGPESADVATLTMVPQAGARLRLAAALSEGRGVDYTLSGRLAATPDKGGIRSYEIKRNSTLSPVPGVAGVLR